MDKVMDIRNFVAAAEGDAEVGERSFICLRHLFDEF